ncbi:MAG: aminotransferase class V-fold PLP-dependent enzyme [Lachnospiraceae bacterium]|nr:aminotransferase class V-fold PLP-dependent enzyme [Lachnospiraceae bacterium]
MKQISAVLALSAGMLLMLPGCSVGSVDITADAITVSLPGIKQDPGDIGEALRAYGIAEEADEEQETAEAAASETEPSEDEVAIDPAREELDAFAAEVLKQKEMDFGYPVNQNIALDGFYDWFQESGYDTLMANNAGDPFVTEGHYHLNALSYEREVIDFFGPLYGYDPDDLWGIVTFSGTDGNDHGIYFGAKYLESKTKQKPVVYVSDAAHYSNMRLADLQNLDLVLVPADEHGCMIPEEFEKMLVKDRPALMVYAMGTTFKGGVDDQAALNAILDKYPSIEVYRHVDAALFGGYLPYTEYKDAVDRRVAGFDSIAVSGHKFFGMDEPAGIFLTTMEIKDNQNPYEVSYLNGSMPMINCSRSALSALKFWWIIKHVGIEGFTEQANGMLETAEWLKGELDAIGWEAWLEPMSNTVYFKRPPQEIAAKYDLAPDYDERLGGDLSHIVVMQHVTKERLQGFLDDLAAVE